MFSLASRAFLRPTAAISASRRAAAMSSAATSSTSTTAKVQETSRAAKPYPQTSTSNPEIVPIDEFPQTRSPMEEKDLRDHQRSGLTTSHPSPEIVSADVLSDAPPALHYRQVRIYQPTKTTMQSGKAGTDHWRIDFDVLQGGGRWENALMGWASSADYMQGTTIKFKSKDDAIHFAEKQGWSYQVDEAHQPRIPPKSYSENYVHVPGKLRIHKTK